jgi:hypothetical protein
MSDFRKVLTYRVNDTTPDDHVGRRGEITYRDGFLYYHDGETPGGEIIGGGGSGGGGPTSWASVTGKPNFAAVATSGSYADLTNKPSIPTNVSDLTNDSGFISSVAWADVTGKPVFFSGAYADLTGKPSLFSGAYADLTGKPSIPDLTGYATEAWVNSQGFGSGGGGTGAQGPAGADGADGAPGQGVPTGGTAGQVLAKVDSTDYNTEWVNQTGGATNEITNTDGFNTYSVSVGTDGVVTMNTARGSIEFGAMPEVGAPQHLHIMRPADQGGSTDLYFGDDYNYFKLPGNYGAGTLGVDIGANDGAGGAQHVWRFGTDGNLTLPAGGDIKDSTGASVLGGGFSGAYADLSGLPTLFDGDYNSLTNKPTYRIAVPTGSGPGGNLQADSLALAGLNPVTDIPSTWGGDLILQGGVGGANGDLYGEVRIKSGTIGANYEWHFTSDKKIKLPAGGSIVDSTGTSVLFSGSYDDLTNKPTIPTDVSDLTDTTSLLFSGSYDDLTDKPTLFTANQSLDTTSTVTFDTVNATNITINGQPTTVGTVNPTIVTNNSPNMNSWSNGTSSSPATTVFTLSIPSAGTWKLEAWVRVIPTTGNPLVSGGFYTGGTLVANSETLLWPTPVTGATGSGYMSTIVTTTGAETYTVGLWANATGIGMLSDSTGRTKATATLLTPSIAVNTAGLTTKASGFVNRGADVTLGNLKARIAASGNSSLQVSTVSGTLTVYGSSASGILIDGGTTPLTITTTPAYLKATTNLGGAGESETWLIRDDANSIAWRISCVIGVGYNNNMISIEQLV